MAHIPKFPPVFEEWAPGEPPFEPPLPRFMFNPWLDPAERQAIMQETGEWATARAEAMIPPSAGPEAARRAAMSMWQGLQRRYGIETPTITAPTPARRPRRRAAAPTAPTAPTLAPEQRLSLINSIREFRAMGIGTARGPVKPGTLDVQEWAQEKFGVAITESEAALLVQAAT